MERATHNGDTRALEQWLVSELDSDGRPVGLPPTTWPRLLSLADQVFRKRGASPGEALAKRLDGLRATLWALERGGRGMVFEDETSPAARSLGPRRAPSASIAFSRHRFAILRHSPAARGDLIALDHPLGQASSRLDLFAGRRSWIIDSWAIGFDNGSAESTAKVKWLRWHTDEHADAAEWVIRQGSLVVTRTVVLVRGWKVAFLADQVDNAEGPAVQSLEWRRGIQAKVVSGQRALALHRAGATSTPRISPLALPPGDYATERGRIDADSSRVSITYSMPSSRVWLPLLVSWDGARERGRLRWRGLTITQNRKLCAPETACAVRIGWAKGDSLVIYRSLARPALRAFLGHQTESKLFVGRFSSSGDLNPLLKIP